MPGKRILLIIPEMVVGGAANSMAKLSVELAREHTVFLVVFNRNDTVDFKHGGELLSLDVVPGKSIFSKMMAFVKRVHRLKQIKKEKKIDVSLSFLEGADYVNVLSKVGEKVIISIRGSKVHDENMQGNFFKIRKSFLIPRIYNKADHIVVVNSGIVDELVHVFKITGPRISVINNFYDVGNVSRSEQERPVLVTTGRLSREKGVDGLIRMFAILKKTVNAQLVIVGDGPQRPALEQLCKDLSLNDVNFVGRTSDVYKFLSPASVYLMNSSSEGFPNGLVEAMIAGVPVISSDCPYGPAEILDRKSWHGWHDTPYFAESGILMPPIDTEEHLQMWADTVALLLRDKGLQTRFINAANERVKDFQKPVIMNQWLKIISE